MRNRYEKILKQDSDLWAIISDSNQQNTFDEIAWNVISPVIILYTLWIVTEAEKYGLKRLYFFARDGYLMQKIAEVLCRTRKNGIICSYFFCSRYALRMASYHFFDETAYERLFLHAYQLTACSMLKRAGFDVNERKRVYADISFQFEQEQKTMGRAEFDSFCTKIRNSAVFREILLYKSESAYSDMIAYIRQEEMQKYDTIGIVDLGWTGSLQATLRRLLDSDHICTKVIGFYMGMLDRPPKHDSSVYYTWLFDENELYVKAWFSHNLMECICSAPHGMTMGYQNCQGKMIPIFAERENQPELSEKIQHIIFQFMGFFHGNTAYQKHHKKIALHLLKKLMLSPTAQEAESLSRYSFCDDVGEQYHRSIVQSGKPKDFRRELLFCKLFYRDSTDGFYWYYGSVAVSRLSIKIFYRYGYLLTRYIIMKLKRR